MNLHPNIRRASQKDLPSIQALLEEEHLAFDDVSEIIDNFLVAEVDDKIIGTVGIEFYDSKALLRSAAVSSSYQGHGIGALLTERAIAEAAKRGIRELILLTTTAERFFTARGFSIIKRENINGRILSSSQFRGACPSTATVMHKFLQEG